MLNCPSGMNIKVNQLITGNLSASEIKEVISHVNNCNTCDFKLTKSWKTLCAQAPPPMLKILLGMVKRQGFNENSRGLDVILAIQGERDKARTELSARGIEVPESLDEFVEMMKSKGIDVQVHKMEIPGSGEFTATAEFNLPVNGSPDIMDVLRKVMGAGGIQIEQPRTVKNVNGVEVVDLAHQFQVNNAMGEAPKCPTCGRGLDGVLASDGTPIRPKAGDTTICIHCEIPLQFTKTMDLKAITPEEQEEWPAFFRQKINHSLQMLRQYKANRPHA